MGSNSLLFILLLASGLVAAAGGVVMLIRASRTQGSSPRSAYLPLGMIAVGLIIAYRTFSDFDTLDTQDIAIMFLFAVALITMAGLQLFVVDKYKSGDG